MELSDNLLNNDTAEMTFTVNGKETVIPVSEAQETALNDKTVYAFTCYVSAAEMTDIISAQVSMGENKGEVFTYSVQTYAEYILDNPTTYSEYVPVVKAMLNYGAAAQEYFEHNTVAPANSVLAEGDKTTAAVTLSELEAYKCTNTDQDEALDFDGFVISLKSRITAKLYFSDGEFTAEDFTVLSGEQKVNSSRLTVGSDSNGTYLAISDIEVGDFDRSFTVSVGGITVNDFSVYSYMYQYLVNDRTDLTDLVNTLYAYNEAVEAIA